MKSFTLNKRPLTTLLERGYMQRLLENEVPPKYVTFLALMINRPFAETGTELLARVAPHTLQSTLISGPHCHSAPKATSTCHSEPVPASVVGG